MKDEKSGIFGSVKLSVAEVAIILAVLVCLYLVLDGNVSFQLLHPNP